MRGGSFGAAPACGFVDAYRFGEIRFEDARIKHLRLGGETRVIDDNTGWRADFPRGSKILRRVE